MESLDSGKNWAIKNVISNANAVIVHELTCDKTVCRMPKNEQQFNLWKKTITWQPFVGCNIVFPGWNLFEEERSYEIGLLCNSFSLNSILLSWSCRHWYMCDVFHTENGQYNIEITIWMGASSLYTSNFVNPSQTELRVFHQIKGRFIWLGDSLGL